MVFCHRDESGLTLVEILVAVAIIMIGLVAVMQWYPMGTAGVESGRRQSTGVFLAEQKIEQIKGWALSTCTGPPGCAVQQGFATVVQGGACCPNDAFNSIPGYPEYSRTVAIANDPLSATRKVVRVQVQYRRVTTGAVLTGGTQVDIATLIAQH
ncbi:MAG: prepilin-type N-terminal cleavage/methylation domain-containing protein [Candidatus Rokubacteria bacterium]|nr:prepilin-type N-terminal cleavage/methylation domain-containing protein [Candidatus Rokubacteria bacterium]